MSYRIGSGLMEGVIGECESFKQVDIHETGQAILAVKVPNFQKWTEQKSPLRCTLFVPFQDPRNVGRLFFCRSCGGTEGCAFEGIGSPVSACIIVSCRECNTEKLSFGGAANQLTHGD